MDQRARRDAVGERDGTRHWWRVRHDETPGASKRTILQQVIYELKANFPNLQLALHLISTNLSSQTVVPNRRVEGKAEARTRMLLGVGHHVFRFLLATILVVAVLLLWRTTRITLAL